MKQNNSLSQYQVFSLTQRRSCSELQKEDERESIIECRMERGGKKGGKKEKKGKRKRGRNNKVQKVERLGKKN